MKLTSSAMKKIENFSKKCYLQNDPAHGLEHMYMTEKLAVYLARKERADVNICRAAALLHDIVQTKWHHDHETRAVPIVKKFLKEIHLDDGIIEQVAHAVECHSYHTVGKARTKEAKIIYDADKLQVLGTYGFVKAMAYRITAKKMATPDAVLDAEKLQNSVIKQLKTRAAKSLMRKHHKFMKQYFKYYKEFRNIG